MHLGVKIVCRGRGGFVGPDRSSMLETIRHFAEEATRRPPRGQGRCPSRVRSCYFAVGEADVHGPGGQLLTARGRYAVVHVLSAPICVRHLRWIVDRKRLDVAGTIAPNGGSSLGALLAELRTNRARRRSHRTRRRRGPSPALPAPTARPLQRDLAGRIDKAVGDSAPASQAIRAQHCVDDAPFGAEGWPLARYRRASASPSGLVETGRPRPTGTSSRSPTRFTGGGPVVVP